MQYSVGDFFCIYNSSFQQHYVVREVRDNGLLISPVDDSNVLNFLEFTPSGLKVFGTSASYQIVHMPKASVCYPKKVYVTSYINTDSAESSGMGGVYRTKEDAIDEIIATLDGVDKFEGGYAQAEIRGQDTQITRQQARELLASEGELHSLDIYRIDELEIQ